MNDIEARIQVLSPKAGDTIAVTHPHILGPAQRQQLRDIVKARLPEGVEVLVLDGGLTIAHVESPEAANERHELLCEVKALRYEMAQLQGGQASMLEPA